jgi:hypothetical protein
MRLLLLAICLLVEALAFSQGFNRRYDFLGLGTAQTALNIELLPDGYLTIGGGTDYDSIAPGVFFTHGSVHLTRINQNGIVKWEKRAFRPFHTALPGWSNCCDTIPGGGYVVGGASEDTTGFDEVYLMRFDTQGDTLWTRVFGDPAGNNYWIGRQVKHLSDGGFLIVGDRGGNFGNNVDGFIIRTDSEGSELWRATYGGALIDGIVSIEKCSSLTYFTGGVSFSSMTNSNFWVQRVNLDGDVLWSRTWGGEHKESNAQLAPTNDGHAFVAGGWSFAPDFSLMRPYLAKLDSADGSTIWERFIGPQAYSTLFFAGKETPSGDLIAAGVSYANATTDQQGLLCRTTSEGDSIWMYNYFYQDEMMSDGTGRFYDVLPTADGGFIAAGATYFSASGHNPQGISQDTWVVKVDADGCIVPGCNTVGITEQATNLLDALRIWPNPAQGQCTVHLELPASIGTGALLLTVVAADGRVAQQHSLAGNGTHPLDLRGLSAGLSHVHVSQGGRWLTGGKVVVE